MAEASVSWAEDQFMCPVCLDLLKEPVTIPCGHSYCMSCITDCWDQDDQKGIYSCPSCKLTFTPRPVLAKNVVFAQMVEKLRKTIPQTAAPEVHHAGPGDVQCDACTGNKQKAVKSCQECQSSYCRDHLDHHERLFRGRGHNLMDATGRLQEMICPQHNKMMEIYCRTDQRCICMLCLVDEHKNHNTVSTAAERKEKQEYFEETQRKIQNVIKEREKDLQQLREALYAHKRLAQTAVEDSEKIFTELTLEIEKRIFKVNRLIRDQERAAVSRAEEHLERLKQEIHDLKRRNTELMQLSGTPDHVHFLQSLSSVSLTGSTDSGFTISSLQIPFDNVVKSVSQFRNKLLQLFSEEIEEISKEVKTVQVIGTPEDQTSVAFQQYSQPGVVCSAGGPRSPLSVTLLGPRESKPSPTAAVDATRPSDFKPSPTTNSNTIGMSQSKTLSTTSVNTFGSIESEPLPINSVQIIGQSGSKPSSTINVKTVRQKKHKYFTFAQSFERKIKRSPTIPVNIIGPSDSKPSPTAPVNIIGPSLSKPLPIATVNITGQSEFKPLPTAPVNILGPSESKLSPTIPINIIGQSESKPKANTHVNIIELSESKPKPNAHVNIIGQSESKPKANAHVNIIELSESKPKPNAHVNIIGQSESKPKANAHVSIIELSESKPKANAHVNIIELSESKPKPNAHVNIIGPSQSRPSFNAPVNIFGLSESKPSPTAPLNIIVQSKSKSIPNAPVNIIGPSQSKTLVTNPVNIIGTANNSHTEEQHSLKSTL